MRDEKMKSEIKELYRKQIILTKIVKKKELAVQIEKKRIEDRDYFVQKPKNYFPGNNFGRTSDIFL